jgi:type VI secretion system protein VasG
VFSARLPTLLEHAWLIASLDGGTAQIRSAHLLLALLTEPGLAQLAQRSSPLLARLPVDRLKHELAALTQGSDEAGTGVTVAPTSDSTDPAATPGATPALDQYTTNLTQRAREGRLDPVIGRDTEIRQAIDILMRRRQNNPILTGEAGRGQDGGGRRAGAAHRRKATCRRRCRAWPCMSLDMGLLQAGAGVKGEFENRLKGVIDEVKRSPHPIILFIDEAHTMIGAGGQAGQNDAANLLKPALARGELRTVAATTWAEYKKYFEKDAALARRFQVVKVDEPSEDIACAMLRAMAGLMQQHFKVRILDQAIVDAVRLSARYISGRQLPDKAIGVLDTACAKVALGQNAVPAAMEERRKRLERVQAEARNLQVEAHAGADHEARLAELQAQVQALEAELAALETRRQDEARHVAEIQRLRAALVGAAPASPASANDSEAATAAPIDRPALLAELHAQESALAALQGDSPLVPLQVDGNAVAEVVSAWTGVPLGKMVKDELRTVLDLAPTLRQRVIGQDHALDAVAERVRTARARLEDPNKPQGVFLFVGPSGVGKTETALALADALFGGERKLVSINMSEYQEAHSVSGLKGSPPGYVGYGEGGVLTEAVRRQPYSVVLLDEVEKAHPDVLELFYQVFDKGVLDDAEGREVDFRNTLIILTSNVGSAQIMQACLNKPADERPTPAQLSEALKPLLYKTFKPAFIGRLDVVPFMPIDDDVLAQIIQLKLGRIGQRVAQQHQARWDVDRKVVDAVLARCTETDTGARNVDHILSGSLLPALAERVLARMADGQGIERVRVGVGKNGDFKLSVN